MDVSIVIPAYREREYIRRPLEAIVRQTFSGDSEVVVVVNAELDGTTRVVHQGFPHVRVFYEFRKGTNYARDLGWRNARGEIIAFLDADTIPPPRWLERGVSCFSDPSVVAAAGPYLYYDGRVRDSIFAIFKRFVFFPAAKAIVEFAGGSLFFFANVFIRRRALEAIGGLDTSRTYGGDDVDTAWRLATHGKIVFQQGLSVMTSARALRRRGLMRKQFEELRWARAVAQKYRVSDYRASVLKAKGRT